MRHYSFITDDSTQNVDAETNGEMNDWYPHLTGLIFLGRSVKLYKIREEEKERKARMLSVATRIYEYL